MIVRADFHLHSCVSPCGDLAMSPRQIAATLKEKNISLAALTDHNTAANCPAFAACCKENGIAALYGMEAQTSEELHALCLFADLNVALAFCQAWYDSLPDVRNKPDITGDQIYVDENENILGELEKYLIMSAPFSLDECAAMVHKAGGLIIPAHVDRAAFSMTSQLGAIVAGDWDALEFVRPHLLNSGALRLPAPYPVTTSSDAHYVEDIGKRAFDLDVGDAPLLDGAGRVNLAAVREGLARRMVQN